MDSGTKIIIVAVAFILLLGSIFETGLIVYSFLNADSVKCDLFSCVATKTTSSQITERYCSMNGKEVDCDGR